MEYTGVQMVEERGGLWDNMLRERGVRRQQREDGEERGVFHTGHLGLARVSNWRSVPRLGAVRGRGGWMDG